MFKKLFGKLYVIALMVFTVWYGYFIYPVIFSHAEHEEAVQPAAKGDQKKPEAETEEEKALHKFMKEQKSTASTDLGYTVVKEQFVKGHFHHIGMTVESDETNVCVRCHGAVPHDKAKPIRAFLNMHAFFVACETCHIRPKQEGEGPWAFRWYDKKSGQVVANPPGLVSTEKEKYGNYGTKIAPGTLSPEGTFRFLNSEKERAFVVEYLKNKDALSSTEQSKMKKVIHRKVNEKPLMCDGCHTTEKPYLPFAELGYPPRRIQIVTGTEVVGMIQKYRDFYIPKGLLPGVGWSERGQAPGAPQGQAPGTEQGQPPKAEQMQAPQAK